MILGAALLVLVALGLFVGGIATGATALYWACVAVSAIAAVLLVLARRQLGRPGARGPAPSRGEAGRTAETSRADAGASLPRTGPDAHESRVTPRDDIVPGRGSVVPRGANPMTDGTAAQPPADRTVDGEDDEPSVEEVEVTDLLLVMDLHEDVVVVDEHPRYHLADCIWLRDRTPLPLPLDEARTDGFTPCGLCAPDRHLAAVERERRSRRGAS